MDWKRRLAGLFFCAFVPFASVAFADSAMTPEQQDEARQKHEAEAKFLRALYGNEAPKAWSHACFVRVYDAAHLKAHPYQKVVEIRISVHYKPVVKAATVDAPAGSNWGYAIHSRLRNGKLKSFLDDGSCGGGPAPAWDPRVDTFKVRCDAACDAGDDLYVDSDGKKALLSHKLDLIHPELDGPGSDPNAKLDDSLFRVYRASNSECTFDKP